jgi:2-polyprenyl-3-methyl-5-hydroxy-6-metoxy-1,4-benzoquinol methylase
VATDRKAHWEQIYATKSPAEVSWYQAEPTLSLELIHNAGVPRSARIIDVGGGASVLVDFLCREGFTQVAVLDISGAAIRYAQTRLGKAADRVEWFESDITAFSPPHRFDLWHDRAVFHFLTKAQDRTRYVRVLRQALVPGGHVIIAAFALGGPTQCSGLDVVQYDAESMAAELGAEFTLRQASQELHRTPGNKQQPFNYFRFQRRVS